LRVLIHLVTVRANGLADVSVGDRIDGEIAWGETRCHAVRLEKVGASPSAKWSWLAGYCSWKTGSTVTVADCDN
jgi:hypothetical protein